MKQIKKKRHSRLDLDILQALDLETKILKTKQRIREWYSEFGSNGVYLSFSGGKDSSVLADIVASVCAEYGYNLTLVFVDTGLEFPEIKSFVKEFPVYLQNKHNIIVELVEIRPPKTHQQVLTEYGYPLISKEVSKIVYGCRHGISENSRNNYKKKLKGLNPDNTPSEYKQRYTKYEILLNAPFEISNRCCYFVKEKPCLDYERQTGRKPIIATMACESEQRKEAWLKTGCNAFENDEKNRPQSKPISFWLEQDILHYIFYNNLPYATIYGDLIPLKGQCSLFEKFELEFTGEQRTVCMYCLFGAHLDEITRLQRLQRLHPKIYNYCMNGGEINKKGMLIPNKKGLGYRKLLSWANSNIPNFKINYEK